MKRSGIMENVKSSKEKMRADKGETQGEKHVKSTCQPPRSCAARASDHRKTLFEFLINVLPTYEIKGQSSNISGHNSFVPKILSHAVPSKTHELPPFLHKFVENLPPSIKKVQFLLQLIQNVKAFSLEGYDCFAQAAGEELPKIAFSHIWTTIEENPPPHLFPEKVNSEKLIPSVQSLLEFASKENRSSEHILAVSEVCSDFIVFLTEQSRLLLLRRLLKTCHILLQCNDLSMDKVKRDFEGLHLIMENPVMIGSFAQLLKEEVELSKDNLQETELGSTLSYGCLPIAENGTNGPTFLSFAGCIASMHSKCSLETAKKGINAAVSMMLLKTRRLQELLSSVFLKLLLSEDSQMRDTVLCWTADVLNKTSSSFQDHYACMVDISNSCQQTYLMNLCCVLLDWMDYFRAKSKLSRTVDLCYYSSPACKLKSSCLVNLADRPITPASSYVEKHFDVVTECFCFSLLALSIGVLNTMSLALQWKEKRMNEDSALDGVTMLMKRTLEERTVCERVTKMYVTLSESLLGFLETAEANEETNAVKKKLLLSNIPRFCIRGMMNWIKGLKHLGIEVEPLWFASFLNVSVLILQVYEGLSCLLRFQLIETIVICKKKLTKELLQRILPTDVTGLYGVLVETFVDVSSLEGLQVFSGTFRTYPARADIVELLSFWNNEHIRQALLSLPKPDFLPAFLRAVLETITMQCQCVLERQVVHSSMEKNEHGTPSEEDTVGKCLGDQSVFQLLCHLAEEKDIAVLLTRPPLATQTAVAVASICQCLILAGTSDRLSKFYDDLSDMILHLAAEDSRAERGLLWSFANRPELLQALVLYILLGSSMSREWPLLDLSKELKCMHARLRATRNETIRLQSIHPDRHNQTKSPVPLSDDWSSQGRLITASLVRSHTFTAILEEYTPASKKMAILKREMEHLQEDLSIASDKTILLVRDSERYDVLRCVVSGPLGTPYSGGLFVFDMYCPDGYPSVPPLVRFLTTGYGTADFHACLHVNGEVFLNLLGTGSEDDGSDSWNPNKTTLRDVLQSIQQLLSEEKPLFSYTSKQSLRNSQRGEEESRRHNEQLQVLTVRYAMLEQVRNPPAALENVIRQYFSAQRQILIVHMRKFMEKPLKHPLGDKLKCCMAALLDEFKTLEEEEHQDD